ncbi:hypothetical protein [Streptomyces sp. CNQ085]|uniref:hypothetical protein n=1 Tax=Streptomyces sp. CNQ085 TaxID=2886944 RepID=UPI001F50FDEE|nr:hypothetical protein [Streptomyces sp. CNQ085]MCI0386184.1 hypothetical protein [Streptomyces sp. CNQ085]
MQRTDAPPPQPSTPATTQADEALHRAQDGHDIRRILTTVADRLSTLNPQRPMDDGALLVLAHRAADPRGTGRCALLRTANAARAQAPQILPGDTRADYATRIRLHLAGVHA